MSEYGGTKGVAPWERSGLNPLAGPSDPENQARAARAVAMQEQLERERNEALAERERRREEKRLAKLKKLEEEKIALEKACTQMFYIGFLLLPVVWINMIWYYWKEFRDPEANPKIRRQCRIAMYMIPIYIVPFFLWFVVFLAKRNDWPNLNMLNATFQFEQF